eukprot:7378317-Prymnesium_polylepis.1
MFSSLFSSASSSVRGAASGAGADAGAVAGAPTRVWWASVSSVSSVVGTTFFDVPKPDAFLMSLNRR